MSYISVVGGNKLEGEVELQGSKNAALPVLAAGILCKGTVRIYNCPDISDIRELLYALSYAGVKSTLSNGVLELDTSDAKSVFLGPEFAGKTRGGVLLLGAFLGRFGEAGMAYPGGCVIGARPIDLHCNVFRGLSLAVTEEADGVFVKGTPKGGRIVLSYPSVGATENAIIASVCGKGRTVILGAAREPEIMELCRFLRKAGAKIYGEGTARILIDGVSCLHEVEYSLAGDRIVAGTYLVAGAMCGGKITLQNTQGVCMKGIFESLYAAGVKVYREKDCISVQAPNRLLAIKQLKTAPFPAFPTDMQSQMAVLLTQAEGESMIYETVFESRFGIVSELCKMGADVMRDGRRIIVKGRKKLFGTEVAASDLRSGAALVLASLVAEGESKVYGFEYILRGYEDICGMFGRLGANITLCEEE